MRKGCGASGGGGINIGGTAGLYTPTLQNHHQWGGMVQRNGGNGGGGGRIFVSSHHHPQHQQGAGPYGSAAAAAAAALHQSGILLGHHNHPGGLPQHHQQQHHQHHSHHHQQHQNNPHQGLHRPPSHVLSGQFQNSHLGGHGHGGHHNNQHQFGGGGPLSGGSSGLGGGGVVNSLNSHFNSISSSSTSGGGGSSGGGVGSAGRDSTSGQGGGGGVGDMPPVETVVARLETACRLLHGIGGNNTRVAEISSEIQILSEDLRRVGALLENTYPEVLDRLMSSMRDASAQPCLPPSLRLAIFELVELRASKWLLPSDSSNYYRQRRNLNEAAADSLLDEPPRTPGGRNTSGGGGGVPGGGTMNNATSPLNNNCNNVSVIVTNCASGVGGGGGGGGATSNNPIKPEVIFPTGSTSPSANVDNPTPPPAKTYREEIVIKNSDSGKVAPTAKERVLSINGYSQQSINLAKQLIQETITRNASPVLEGMVLPSSSSSCGDFPDMSGLDEVELGLKRMQMQSSSSSNNNSPHHHHGTAGKLDPHNHSGGGGGGGGGGNSSHFSYTVTLGDHSIKILGDDIQYVQEAKMALDDYFLQKYPDLFCASNSIEDVEEEEEEELEDVEEDNFQDGEGEEEENLFGHRYDRETLLSLSKLRTPTPDFSHLEPDIRGIIILEKRREFDLDKFTRETSTTVTSTTTITNNTTSQHLGPANNVNNNKVTTESLPG